MIKILLRHNLIVLLMLCMLTPAILLTIEKVFHIKKLPNELRSDYKLSGATENKPKTPRDIRHFKSHAVQKNLEETLVSHLPLRSFFIRLNNRIYFTLFKKSYSQGGSLIIGKNNQLFSQCYIDTYCSKQTALTNTKLKIWADKLKILHNYYAKQGKTFIYLITPSKAEYMPEAIPDRFICKKRGISDSVIQLTKLLDERKVPYINGPALMVNATHKYGVPMFPQGGIHWNDLGSTIATNEVISAINRQKHINISNIQFTYEITKQVDLRAQDLFNLLNLFHSRINYCVPKVSFTNQTKQDTDKSLCFIGGSFCDSIFHVFLDNKLFSHLSYFRYLKIENLEYKNNKIKSEEPNMSTIIDQINSSDVIILEENSELIHSKHGQLYYKMLKTSLASIKDR